MFGNFINQFKNYLRDFQWPNKKQLAQLPKTLSHQELRLSLGLIFIILASLFILSIKEYLNRTQVLPDYGGEYKEGIIGQPRFLNPVLAQTNDADRDLVQIIFSSLLKYDGNGDLILDLAESYEIKENGLIYDFVLKDGIKWHDKEPLLADDVIFTIKTIQDFEYKSPLRNNWLGVEIEKIDERTVRFRLKNVYAPFLHNTTIGILPKHLWAGISPQNFALAEYNQRPIGSGPYKFKKFEQSNSGAIYSIELEKNKDFYLKEPYFKKIIFKFYASEEAALFGLNKRQVDGLSFLSASHQSDILGKRLNIYQISLPRYYVVFFNQNQSKALSDKTVRLALSYAVDKKQIIDEVLMGQGLIIDTPLLADSEEKTEGVKIYDFSLEHSQNILEDNGWKDKDGDGVREKKINDEEVKLEISLTTTQWPELVKSANLLKDQWEKIGAKINLEIIELESIQKDYIRPRKYQTLLFGEVLGADADPFAFWHSSQKKDPGLNLALYSNKKADKLLEEARQTLDKEIRAEKYREFQKLVTEDAPAVFLYSPTYLYPVDKKIKGVLVKKLPLPSQRFSQIEEWHIKTKRERK